MKKWVRILLIIVVIAIVLYGAFFAGTYKGMKSQLAMCEVDKKVDSESLNLFAEEGKTVVRDSSGKVWKVDNECLRG